MKTSMTEIEKKTQALKARIESLQRVKPNGNKLHGDYLVIGRDAFWLDEQDAKDMAQALIEISRNKLLRLL